MMWFTDIQACLYAWINPDTLYDYQKKHPWYSERKAQLKEALKAQAKMNIAVLLKYWDADMTKFFAETKMSDEFSKKPAVEQKTEILVVNNVRLWKLKEMLNEV